MFSKTQLLKYAGAALLALAVAVTTFSLINNYPIRFRPKWNTAANSHAALHPSKTAPDNITLTPVADMATGITVNWRTSATVQDAVIQYAEAGGAFAEQAARRLELMADELKSDKKVHVFSATLDSLKPGTAYSYRVGSRQGNAWSEYRTFVTAAGEGEPFSFVYLGDLQLRPDKFGRMLRDMEKRHPQTAFYMQGGDLVDMGDLRNLWDDLLLNTHGVFAGKALAPALGNHDYGDKRDGLNIYTSYFTLPANGPEEMLPGAAYSFAYNNGFFIVLDSGQSTRAQAPWLEAELAGEARRKTDFTVVMFHNPVYNPRSGRDNARAQKNWVPLFDKYQVDLVLTGHDHSYMRSKRLQNGELVADGKSGTIYVVATACEKYYKAQELDVAAVQLTNVATYQKIDIGRDDAGRPRLRFAACDEDGRVLDAFEMTKPLTN